MTAADIERYNRHTLLCVARAALEDLLSARLAHGSQSLVYRQQVARSMGFIEGSLEALLAAAVRELDRRASGTGTASQALRAERG
jgi:hypothetical protein